MFFLVESPCGLDGTNPPTNPQGDSTQKQIIRIVTAVKMLNLTRGGMDASPNKKSKSGTDYSSKSIGKHVIND